MKTIARRRRGQRGWVMLVVMLVLLVISIIVAAFFLQASDAAAMGRILTSQQVAVSHAEFGLQDGIRALRAQQIPVTGMASACTDAEVDANICGSAIISPLVDNGQVRPLNDEGGLQYQYLVYKRPSISDPGQPPNRYVIRATGYYGYSLVSPNLVTSVVEAEIDLGKDNKFKCTGGYECQ